MQCGRLRAEGILTGEKKKKNIAVGKVEIGEGKL